MIKAGEISGNLEKTVSTLASRFEAEHERANAMRAQLAYPILMIHAAVLIPAMPIMVTSCPSAYVFTVCMILLPLYLAFFLLLALSRISRVSSELAYVLSAVANCVPVWRGVRRLEAQGRFLECLAQLIEAGMLAGQSLEIAASACGNEAYARSWKRFSDDISNGLKISQALQNSKTFSAQVYSMIAAGEESGNIVSMASKAADYLLDEAVQQRKRLMAVMPVVLLLLIGIVVAYQVISIFGGYSCSLRGMM
ncbi:type II secretion system F family protein [bacterium]|nr:type II secretion system F family protein [bacterium]